MKPRLLGTSCLTLFLLFTGSWSISAQSFTLQSGFVDWSPGSTVAAFSLTFNRVPDFLTVDQFGRQADAFQFYIGPTTSIPDLNSGPWSSIIRGGEIHVAGDIRVRDQSPPDENDPNSSGWGAIRQVVPFALNGSTLSFSVPMSALNVQDQFGYQLLLTTYGSTSGKYFGPAGGPIPVSVPEPGVLALSGLAGLAALLFGKRMRGK